MRNTTKTIVALLSIGLFSAGCGEGEDQSGSLSELLTSRPSFVMDADNLIEMTGSCGESVPAGRLQVASVSALAETLPTEGGQNAAPEMPVSEPFPNPGPQAPAPVRQGPRGGDLGDLTVSFTPSKFFVESDESTMTLLYGTWREIDRNTIEVTTDGETFRLDVIVRRDTILFNLPTGTNLDCSNEVPAGHSVEPGESPVANQPPSEPVIPKVTEIKKGTWCYESGDSAPKYTYSVVESLLFYSYGKIGYVKYFFDNYYHEIDEITPDPSASLVPIFTLKAYHPWNSSGQFEVNSENTIIQSYGPYQTTLKWISADLVTCPGSS